MSRFIVIASLALAIITMASATNWLDTLQSDAEDSYSLRKVVSAATEGVTMLYRVPGKMIGIFFKMLLYVIGWMFFGTPFIDDRAPVIMPDMCGRGIMSRIIGGENSPATPWIVSLRVWKKHTCGGALITARHVLTAAHCVNSWRKVPGVLNIGMGSNTLINQTLIGVSKVTVNGNFRKSKDSPLDGDIAILTMREDVEFNQKIGPICLPELPPDVGLDALVMGWGRTIQSDSKSSPELLQAVIIPVYPPEVCTLSYGKMFTDNMICAGDVLGGKDSCQGDSGGPLVVTQDKIYTQIGVVSFGKGCGQAGYPGVYTNIVNYKQWLMDQIRQ